MSHSVFKDFDDEVNNDTADANVIVFIGKDGEVTVDQNALQDLIVNANTDKKTTVSVIRVGSPTPSMESTSESEVDEKIDKTDDDDEESEDESSDDDDDMDDGLKSKKKKKKNSKPRIALTVESFYNPEEANKFAKDIMSIAGITNPRQLKADFEYLREVIANDHCYTTLTLADVEIKKTSKETPVSTLKAGLKNLTSPKKGTSKTPKGKSTKTASADDTADSDTGADVDMDDSERLSDEEAEESETDLSDLSVSDSDNDRDSDLDFNVNDRSSRRPRKLKKKRAAAKKRLEKAKKRRIEGNTPDTPDDSSSRRRSGKTSKKAPIAKTPPEATSAAVAKAVKPSTVKSAKQMQREKMLQILKDDRQPVVILKKTQPVQAAGVTSPPPTPVSTVSTSEPVKSYAPWTKREKKTSQSDGIFSDATALFTSPDIIKSVRSETTKPVKVYTNTTLNTVKQIIPTAPKVLVTSALTSTVGGFVPLTPTRGRSNLPQQISVRVHASPTTSAKLASEQDKQLDLIDSLVQEEMNSDAQRTPTKVPTTVTRIPPKILNHSIAQNDIPNIVKMLETPTEAITVNQVTSLSQSTSQLQTSSSIPNIINSTLVMPTITPTLHFSTNITSDTQLLDDDLLESLTSTEDGLTEDLMQHVAQLVEDKNLQQIIDTQVLGVTTASAVTPNKPLETTFAGTTMQLSTPQTPKLPEKESPFVKLAMQREAQRAAAQSAASRTGPMKIIRSNGRVITLPPIEAPTTRGAKRRANNEGPGDQSPKSQVPKETAATAKIKTEVDTVDKSPVVVGKVKACDVHSRRGSGTPNKRTSTESSSSKRLSISSLTAALNADDDDFDEDGSDGSYNSEDDPHRLWCICRQPHNNRFMICCDKCADWFHGKCVNITKTISKEIERRNEEWICPVCKAKQQPSIKDVFNKLNKSAGSSPTQSLSTDSPTTPIELRCIVCNKSARQGSIYCSNECILKHAHSTKASTSAPTTPTNTLTTMPHSKTPMLKRQSSDSSGKMDKNPTEVQKKSGLMVYKNRRVIVYDRKEKRYIGSNEAPTIENMNKWLAQHPNCEAVKIGSDIAEAFKAKQMQLKQLSKDMNTDTKLFRCNEPVKVQTTLKLDASRNVVYVNPSTGVQSKPTPSGQIKPTITKVTKIPQNVYLKPGSATTISKSTSKLPSTSTSTPTSGGNAPKKRLSDAKTTPKSNVNSDNDSVRNSIRSSLKEQLMLRTTELTAPNAIKLTEDEIRQFAEQTELEIYSMFNNETNNKYRAKYRSLIFNIKDRKNQTLFQKISKKIIGPKQLVRMSPEELASQELAQWRENEAKHQLEMITKAELDLLACSKSYVMKTHKGEEVIESRETDPSTSLDDVVTALNSSAVSSTSESLATPSTVDITPLIVKDNRYDKYLGVDSTSSKEGSSSSSSKRKDSHRSRSRSRDHSRHDSKKSYKHKRKRSRDRDREEHKERSGGRDKDKHQHSRTKEKDRAERDKIRDKEREKSRNESKRKDETHDKSGSGSDKGKHDHSTSKEKKPHKETVTKAKLTSVKKEEEEEEDYNLIDKILEAQSTIDRILHPQIEPKKETESLIKDEIKSEPQLDVSAAGLPLKVQPSVSIESDQEPTSTVTIPTPPEHLYQTPPDLLDPAIWSGNITMIDVATFKISAVPFSGDASYIEREFPTELDIVGRISPDTVWDYLNKVKRSKEILILRFTPRSDDDDSAYQTLLTYLDTRKRLGVIKSCSPIIKDFYLLPLAAHKSLPSVLLPLHGAGFESGRPDLLLGIIVKTSAAPCLKRPLSSIGKSPILPKIARRKSQELGGNFTPPSSPGLNRSSLIPPLTSKSSYDAGDENEPYSPGGSDDDLELPPIATTRDDDDDIQRKMDEISRQIEMQKKEIAMLAVREDAFTNSRAEPSVSQSIDDGSEINVIPGLGDIPIPTNLVDILKSIKGPSDTMVTTASTSTNYNVSIIEDEYTPLNPASMMFAPVADYIPTNTINTPGKLAQMTDEELLRMVPDDSLIPAAPPPPPSAPKHPKTDAEPLPPGVSEEEYIP